MFLWLQGFSLNENREWTDSVVILLCLQFQSLNEVTLGNPVLNAELKPGQVDVRYFKITKMVKKKKKKVTVGSDKISVEAMKENSKHLKSHT